MPCGCLSSCGCTLLVGAGLIAGKVGDILTLALDIGNTPCIGLGFAGNDLIATLILDPADTAVTLACTGTGLSAQLDVTDTDTIDLDVSTGSLTADLIIDPADTCVDLTTSPAGLRADLEIDATPAAVELDCGAGGVAATLNTVDGDTIDLDATGPQLTAEVIIDPTSTAPVTVSAAGLKIDCCGGGSIAPDPIMDGQGIVWDEAAGDFRAEDLALDQDLEDLRDDFEFHNHNDEYVPFTIFNPILRAGTFFGPTASGTFILGSDDAGGTLGGVNTQTGIVMLWIPESYAVPGKTTTWRVLGNLVGNSVSPGASFAFSVREITASTTAGSNLQYTAAVSFAATAPLIPGPIGAGPIYAAGGFSAEVPAPTVAGRYALIIETSGGATATNSLTRADATLEMRHI